MDIAVYWSINSNLNEIGQQLVLNRNPSVYRLLILSTTVIFQVFSLSLTNELRREEACMDTAGKPGTTVHLKPCHGGKGNQEWKIDKVAIAITE